MALAVLFLLHGGCVRRTLKLTTEPPGTRVFLNDEEVGTTIARRYAATIRDRNPAGGNPAASRSLDKTAASDADEQSAASHEQNAGHLSVDFLWYGDYDVVIRKEGYETLHTGWRVDAPWYQQIPFDFISEILWPGKLHDVRTRRFVLQPATLATPDELVERALETRAMALSRKK